MKCRACDCFLSDKESVKKDEHTGEYLDLCARCDYEVEQTIAEISEDEQGESPYAYCEHHSDD